MVQNLTDKELTQTVKVKRTDTNPSICFSYVIPDFIFQRPTNYAVFCWTQLGVHWFHICFAWDLNKVNVASLSFLFPPPWFHLYALLIVFYLLFIFMISPKYDTCSCLSYPLSPSRNLLASWVNCLLWQTSRWWLSNTILSSCPLQLSTALSFLECMWDNWGQNPVFNYLQVSAPLCRISVLSVFQLGLLSAQ